MAYAQNNVQYNPLDSGERELSRRQLLIAGGLGALAAAASASYPTSAIGTTFKDHLPDYIVADRKMVGIVVKRVNPDAPNQIYYIAQDHRNPITGKSTEQVVKTQREIYRICEYIYLRRDLNLFFDESFNSDTDYNRNTINAITAYQIGDENANALRQKPSDATLEAILGNDSLVKKTPWGSQDINGLALLGLKYYLNIQGVRDWRLARLVIQNQSELELSLFSHLVEFSTGLELQTIPQIIEREIKAERSRYRNAVVLSGLAHMDELYKYLDQGKIAVEPVKRNDLPKLNREGIDDKIINLLISGMNEPLKLLQQGYGIAIIFPQTLFEKYPELLPEEIRR